MQAASMSDSTQRLHASDRACSAIGRDYVAVRRSRASIADRPFKRSTSEELAEYYATVVRNTDGSIDFDTYRKRAARFRGQQVRSGTVLGLACASVLTLCCACAVIFAISAYANSKPSVRGFNTTTVSIQP